MTKGEQVEALIKSGMHYADAGERVGVHPQYAYEIHHYGGYQNKLSYSRTVAQRQARRKGIPQARNTKGGKKQYAYQAEDVIAAVDSGLSYGDTARKLGISRNVVAGVMNRRAEAA